MTAKRLKTATILVTLILTCNILSFAQESSINTQTTIYLIGDAGDSRSPGPALTALEQEINKDPNSTVLFLGDNIYPRGFYEASTSGALKHNDKLIKAQIGILENYQGMAYFLPGNHDWKKGRGGGMKFIKRQSDYINNKTKGNIRFLPENGEIGPAVIDNNPHFKLILFDSQYYLQSGKIYPFFKSHAKKKLSKAIHDIRREVENTDKTVIIASHHPVFSIGEHGSNAIAKKLLHIPPFFFFGSRRLTVQDLMGVRYRKMNNKIRAMIDDLSDDQRSKIFFAAGHEHNLQYWKYKGSSFIVSGSGSKATEYIGNNQNHKWNRDAQLKYPTSDLLKTKKTHAWTGYMKIIFDTDGNVEVNGVKINLSGEVEPITLDQ